MFSQTNQGYVKIKRDISGCLHLHAVNVALPGGSGRPWLHYPVDPAPVYSDCFTIYRDANTFVCGFGHLA